MFDNLPCIVGVAQETYRAAAGDAPEPIAMWEAMSREAALDSGAQHILQAVDELDVIFSLSWQYDDACAQLANKLALKAGARQLSGLSGTSPQHYVQQAAEKILTGQRDVVLIAGGEALATKKRSKKEGRKLDWPKPDKRPAMPFDDPFHASEIAHEVFQAYLTFAVLDSARRAHRGLSLQQNRQQQAQMMAALSQVAANNPDAWFQHAHSSEALYDVNSDNRMIAYPFTKNSVAIMDVDMAAALLVTSHKKADELGIPKDKRVYLRGWSYAREPIYIAERPELWHSPAMHAAGHQALNMAGMRIDDITQMDLYSCFSSSINFAKDALGIDDADPRALTLTGGLPYFGGPGNNYLSHAITAMVRTLRENPDDVGLLNGVGMHMTNHCFGIYSAQPGPMNEATGIEPGTRKTIQDEASGDALIAAYSVVHGRESNWGLAICDLPNGNRCYARIDDQNTLGAMETAEWVGRPVILSSTDKINRVSG